MKTVVLIFSLFFSFINSQNLEVTYLYKTHKDSTQYVLKLKSEISDFKLKNSHLPDSLSLISSCKTFSIIKREGKIQILDNIEGVLVTTNYEKPNWTLLKEKGDYENYKTKKAKTVFNNEDWFAEYTDEIPVQDGPFIFKDLPGLILNAYNSDNTISLKMIGLTKTNQQEDKCEFDKYKQLDYSKYIQLISQKDKMLDDLTNTFLKMPGLNVKKSNITVDENPIKKLLK